MNYIVKEGNYAQMGAVQILSDEVIFTFAGEKEDKCCVVLIDKKTRQRTKIEVPDLYCLGSLRSISISGFNSKNYFYVYEINGKEQLDPYAYTICGREKWNDDTRATVDYQVYGSLEQTEFDWEGDMSPEISRSHMVMYKLHVRGFTMDHGAPGKTAGTFQAITDKLDYLKSLGITTVELMPLYEFEEMEIPLCVKLPDYMKWETKEEDLIVPKAITSASSKLNYWGYTNGNYFAVKTSYASNPKCADVEYKQMIKQMHRNGIECVMEMFFPKDTNQNLILDALRYWVKEYHVDGFHLLGETIPITAIVQDVMLSRTKIFYANFESCVCLKEKKYKNLFVYKEEYLYPVRKILNNYSGDMNEFINQQKKQGAVLGFVNFVTSNNGFTLADLFMYNDKHNEANGENNQDGSDWNFSNNYGIEGPSRKHSVTSVRRKMWRNAVLMLCLAQGVPMIWSGDEICNSQNGNNNAYCQDNPIGWLNWKNVTTYEDELFFIKQVIAFRKKNPILANDQPFRFCDYRTFGLPDLSLHGENAWISEVETGRKSLGVMYCGAYAKESMQENDIYVAYNFLSAVTTLALPKIQGKQWYLAIDSANEEHPICESVLCEDQKILIIKPQSICVLVGK